MAKVTCIVLDENQMPKAKATITDIRGKRVILELVRGSYSPHAFEERQTLMLRVMNVDMEPETYRGKLSVFDKKRGCWSWPILSLPAL